MSERTSQLSVVSCQLSETETTPIDGSLAREVALLKQRWIMEDGPWYRLPGTGFNVKLQIDQLERDIQKGKKNGQSTTEVLDENFQKIEQDIQGFKTEYLCEGLLFPIVLDKEIVDGRLRVVAAMYGKKQPLSEFISPLERKGAVKRSIENIEEFLLAAPPGSISVMTSPDGPSGFAGITYRDTQTHICRVMENGRPMGFGVRTDMVLAQNRHLLTALGKDMEEFTDPVDQIVDIVKNPVLLRRESNQKGWTFEDVVDIIKFVKKSDFAYKNRHFDEIYQQLQNPQDLWTLDETTKMLTDELKTFFANQLAKDQYSRQDLEIALGITILKLARTIRKNLPENQPASYGQVSKKPPIYMPYQAISSKQGPRLLAVGEAFASLPRSEEREDHGLCPWESILEEVQGLTGCNGGGTSAGSLSSIFTGTIFARHAEYSLTWEKTLNCKCPFCNEQVDAVISGGKITCPECNNSAPYQC